MDKLIIGIQEQNVLMVARTRYTLIALSRIFHSEYNAITTKFPSKNEILSFKLLPKVNPMVCVAAIMVVITADGLESSELTNSVKRDYCDRCELNWISLRQVPEEKRRREARWERSCRRHRRRRIIAEGHDVDK